MVYYGIETGNPELLKIINKEFEEEKAIAALNKTKKANIKISATVILGAGGRKYWK